MNENDINEYMKHLEALSSIERHIIYNANKKFNGTEKTNKTMHSENNFYEKLEKTYQKTNLSINLEAIGLIKNESEECKHDIEGIIALNAKYYLVFCIECGKNLELKVR